MIAALQVIGYLGGLGRFSCNSVVIHLGALSQKKAYTSAGLQMYTRARRAYVTSALMESFQEYVLFRVQILGEDVRVQKLSCIFQVKYEI